MTQEQFAASFGVSTATLRHWERGDRAPRGPALVLLDVIDHNPQAVIRTLALRRQMRGFVFAMRAPAKPLDTPPPHSAIIRSGASKHHETSGRATPKAWLCHA